MFHCFFTVIFAISLSVSLTDGKPGKGRLFGLQLSDPEAPNVPIIAEYVPNTVIQINDVVSDPSPFRRDQQTFQRRKQKKWSEERRRETVGAALRDIPDDWLPILERPVEPIANPIAGDITMKCPKGFELTHDRKCILTVYRDPVKSCPYGSYRNSQLECEQVDSIPPEFVCPALFDVFLRGCIRRIRTLPMLSCPSGYHQYDETCLHANYIRARPKCPEHYLLTQDPQTPSKADCTKHISIPATVDCPKGFVPLSRQLLLSLYSFVPPSVPIPLNPVETVSNTPQCVRVIEKESEVGCPPGYVLEESPKGKFPQEASTTTTTAEVTTTTERTHTKRLATSTAFTKSVDSEHRESEKAIAARARRTKPNRESAVKNDGSEGMEKGKYSEENNQKEDVAEKGNPITSAMKNTKGTDGPRSVTSTITMKLASTSATTTTAMSTTTAALSPTTTALSTTTTALSTTTTAMSTTTTVTSTTTAVISACGTTGAQEGKLKEKVLKASSYRRYIEENNDPFLNDKDEEDIPSIPITSKNMLRDEISIGITSMQQSEAENTINRETPKAKQGGSRNQRKKRVKKNDGREQLEQSYKGVLNPLEVFARIEVDRSRAELRILQNEKKEKQENGKSSKEFRCIRRIILTPINDFDENDEFVKSKNYRNLNSQDEVDDAEPRLNVFNTKSIFEIRKPVLLAITPVDLNLSNPNIDTEISDRERHEKHNQNAEGLFELEVLQLPSSSKLSEELSECSFDNDTNSRSLNVGGFNPNCREQTEATESLEALVLCPDMFVLSCKNEEWITNMNVTDSKNKEENTETLVNKTRKLLGNKDENCEKLCKNIEVMPGSWACPKDLKLCATPQSDPTCEGVEKIPANFQCPITSQNPDKKGFCETLLSEPLETRCPDGTHIGPQETDEQKKRHLGTKGIDWGEPPGTQVIPGLCERVEYAEYQTICPTGYQQDSQGSKHLKVCTTKKIVPPAFICEPGFLQVEHHEGEILCAKTLEAAPTLMTLEYDYYEDPMAGGAHGDISVCQINDHKKLSCSQQRRFYGDVTDIGLKLGDKFKTKMDNKSS